MDCCASLQGFLLMLTYLSCSASEMGCPKYQRLRHAIMEHTGPHEADMSCACTRVLLCIF